MSIFSNKRSTVPCERMFVCKDDAKNGLFIDTAVAVVLHLGLVVCAE